MSKVLNKAQAMSILAKLETPSEAVAESNEQRGHGERLTANAIIARYGGNDDERSWMDDHGGIVYGD